MASPPRKVRWAIFVVLALCALAIRLPRLSERPMHTDEAINGYIIGEILSDKPFHYDPRDRHGPALAAVTLPLVNFQGVRSYADLTETQLRLSPVLTGSLMVLLCGAGVELFGFTACLIAALLFAIAPLPVYYNRYFIHETLFVTATFGLILAGRRFFEDWSLVPAAVAGLCAAIMLASKETALLHFLALGLAAISCRCNHPKAPVKPDRRQWRNAMLISGTVFLLTSVLLFTWFGHNPGVFGDLIRAIPSFAARAGGQGHEKPIWYYAKLLVNGWSGWPIMILALVGTFAVALSRTGWHIGEPDDTSIFRRVGPRESHRCFLAIYAFLIFLFYSCIPYKTPWLALDFWPGIGLLAGIAVEWAWFASGKLPLRTLVLCALAGLGFLVSHDTRLRVFISPADETNPYAYAHTVDDLLSLPDRINALSHERRITSPRIAVVAVDAWPLPWYLRKQAQVGYWQPGQDPGPADFYITSPEAAEKLTDRLKGFQTEYFGLRPEVLILLWTPEPPKQSL